MPQTRSGARIGAAITGQSIVQPGIIDNTAVIGLPTVSVASDTSFPAGSTLVNVTPTTKAVPSVGVWTTDTTTPGGNTQYMRITGISPARKQYSTHPMWDSEEEYVYIEGPASGGGQHSLIRTSDWAVLDELGNVPSYQIWAKTQPHTMFGTDDVNKLLSYNALTDTRTTIATFSGYTALAQGGGDGGISWDDDTFLLTGISGGVKKLMRYRVSTGQLYTRNLGSTSSNHPNNLKASPSGHYGVVNYENTDGTGSEQGLWLIDLEVSGLPNVRQLQTAGDHGDVGKDIDGNDICVTPFQGASGKPVNIYAYRLDQSGTSLDKGRLIPQASGQLFQCGHVSLQSYGRPGYAYLSAYGSWSLLDVNGGYYNAAGYGQVIAVPTDASAFDGTPVEVYGFHRSSHTQDGGDAAYDREPQAHPNRAGDTVAVTTKWSTSTSLLTGATYVFLLRAEQ